MLDIRSIENGELYSDSGSIDPCVFKLRQKGQNAFRQNQAAISRWGDCATPT